MAKPKSFCMYLSHCTLRCCTWRWGQEREAAFVLFFDGKQNSLPKRGLQRVGVFMNHLGMYTLTIALGVDRAFHKGDLRVTVRMMVRVLDPLPPQTPRNNTSQGSLGKSWRLQRPVWAGTSANFELSRKNKAKIEEVKEAHRQRLGTVLFISKSYKFLNHHSHPFQSSNEYSFQATSFFQENSTVLGLILEDCVYGGAGGDVCKLTKRWTPPTPGASSTPDNHCILLTTLWIRYHLLEMYREDFFISLKKCLNSSRHQNKRIFYPF